MGVGEEEDWNEDAVQEHTKNGSWSEGAGFSQYMNTRNN